MKKRKTMPISLTVMVTLSIFLICNVYPVRADPSLCEHYNAGDNASHGFHDMYWMAQTFKVGASEHSVTSVKIKAYRVGDPGSVTAGIRAVDLNGHPSGEDLTNGTIDGNSCTTDTGGAWCEIALAEYTLLPDTSYAIVLRAPDGNASRRISWKGDDSIPGYFDGNEEFSESNGTTWLSYPNTYLMFEVWGNVPSPTPTTSPTAPPSPSPSSSSSPPLKVSPTPSLSPTPSASPEIPEFPFILILAPLVATWIAALIFKRKCLNKPA